MITKESDLTLSKSIFKQCYSKFNICKLLLAVILLSIIFCSCNNGKDIPKISIGKIDTLKSEVFLKNWQIIAPIKISKKDINKDLLAIDKDCLKDWGFSEGGITEKEFKSLATVRTEETLPSKPVKVLYNSNFDYISLTDVFNVSNATGYPQFDSAAYYAMCDIESAVDQDVAILMDGDDNLKVWVNNKLAYRKTDFTPNFRNNGVNAIHLHAGKNKVLVKVYNLGGGSSFYVSLTSLKYAKEIYLNKKNGNFLIKSILNTNESFGISLNKLFFKGADSLKLVVKDVLGNQFYNKNIAFKNDNYQFPVKFPNNEAYTVTLYAAKDSISQQLFIGDTAKYISQFKKKFSSIINDKSDNEINPILIRYSYLNGFAKDNGYDFYIERKVVFCMFELAGILHRIENKIEPFKNVPGLHMRSYTSKIDGQKQYYMVYIPQNYTAKKTIPMVVEMPWIADVHRHFLKGWRVADFKRVYMIIRQADKFGYAFLWSCSRTYNEPNFTPIATTSNLEEISAIKKSYNIDSTKLYLFGSCLGGGNAILAASRNPNMFAAVGVEGPAFDIASLEPIEGFKNLPLFIAHSEIDKKASFIISQNFAVQVAKYGGHVNFVDLHNLRRDYDVNFYPEEIILRNIFSFFKDKRRNYTPDTLTYTVTGNKYINTYSWLNLMQVRSGTKAKITAIVHDGQINIENSNVLNYTIDFKKLNFSKGNKLKVYENNKLLYNDIPAYKTVSFGIPFILGEKNRYTPGPLNDAFADGFVVVTGTTGKKEETQLLVDYGKKLSMFWKNSFNDSCSVITDRQLSSNDIANKNIIIVGSNETNDFLKRISSQIPIKVASNMIKIGRQVYSGQNLTSLMIYPNPLNKKKYIVVITSNNLKELNNFSLIPWYQGVEDYYVFENNGELGSGFFNQQWQ